MGSVKLPPLVLSKQNASLSKRSSSLDNLASDPYNRALRRKETQRGSRTVLQMERLADAKWRHAVPRRERQEFLNKVAPLRSLGSHKTPSVPTSSPRQYTSRTGHVTSPASAMSYAGVTDPDYYNSMERRLIYDRQKMIFREKTNIFPTQKDYDAASRKPPPSPRATSYVTALAKTKMEGSGARDSVIQRNESVAMNTGRSSKMNSVRLGPTQFQSNTGVVTVMKPLEHALVGTAYEDRPFPHEQLELQQMRTQAEHLLRQDTAAMLDTCNRLLNPAQTEAKRTKMAALAQQLVTPTDWNRSISRSPNLFELRSQLPENASPFATIPETEAAGAQKADVVERNRREHSQALATAATLQQLMRPEGRPLKKHFVDAHNKCCDWLQQNFA